MIITSFYIILLQTKKKKNLEQKVKNKTQRKGNDIECSEGKAYT